MKASLLILITLLVIPVAASAHTEIFFPKLFSPVELQTTGFVFVNPDPVIATVNFYLLSADGATLSSTSLTIPAGGQLSRLGNELFPNSASSGWVYVINDTEGMQAFWLNYNGAITAMDGSSAAGYDTIGTDQIIPLVAGQTELNVVNPNFLTVPVTIRLFGANGQLGRTETRMLPIAGAFQAQVAVLFPDVSLPESRYVRIGSATAIASSAVIKGYLVPQESAVVNGVNVTSAREITFPHVVHGAIHSANYTTIIGVTNVSSSTQTVTVLFNTDSGGALTAARTLPPGGSFRETAESLFNLPSAFQAGWVRVSGTAAIVGVLAYSEASAGGLAVVPADAAQSKLFFSHIANGPPQWQTGFALLNSTTTPTGVDVYALNSSGSVISRSRVTLNPGQRMANVIDELLPETRGINGGFVYVKSVDAAPLFGVELFYTKDLKVLSNVSVGKLAPGVAYAPAP